MVFKLEKQFRKQYILSRFNMTNEVMIHSLMMYANPLLIVQAMYSPFKASSICILQYSGVNMTEPYIKFDVSKTIVIVSK